MAWQVFFTPHTDDETIAMGGAIVAAREAGDDVMCVLVTDNIPSRRGSRIFASIDHNIFQARRDEWKLALKTFGIDRCEEWDIAEAMLAMNWFESHKKLYERMLDLNLRLGEVSAFHSTWGFFDTHMETGFGSISHALCANALQQVTFQIGTPSFLYGVYVYSFPMSQRRAPIIRTLTKAQHELKCSAMKSYQQSEHTIGYGFMSVPELFTNASLDPREFVMDITTKAHR